MLTPVVPEPAPRPSSESTTVAAPAKSSPSPEEQASLAPDSPVRAQQAVDAINERLQLEDTDVHLTIDEDTNRSVIKVVDNQTGETVRQIPSEELQEISRRLSENSARLLSVEA